MTPGIIAEMAIATVQSEKAALEVSSHAETPKPHEINASSSIYIDPKKERAIITKFDCLVLPQFVIIIILAYLDRSNIGTLCDNTPVDLRPST